jgi:ATP-dependent protease ClpP protease subunit
MNFEYTVDPNAEEPIMLINKHIGFDAEDGQGINGAQFQAELLALDAMGKSRIKVYINSVGGSVMDGYSIYSAILESKSKVDTYCMGIAASISAVIFQAGRKRYMADYGALMIHLPFIPNEKRSKRDEVLDIMSSGITTMISSRCGMSEDDVMDAMSKTTWYDPKNTPDCGMWDEVVASDAKNKPPRINKNDVQASYKSFAKIVNSLTTKPIIKMSKLTAVCNILGLQDEASEDAIAKAITNALNKKDSELSDLTKAHNSLIVEHNKTKETLSESIKAGESLIADLEGAQNIIKETKINTMLDGFKNVVNAENREFWAKNALEDFEGTEKTLKSFGLAKNGIVINVPKADSAEGNAELSDEERVEKLRKSQAKLHADKIKKA